MRVPITDKYLKNIDVPPPGRSRLDYDTDPHYRGFAICVTATGSISFRCVYTTPEGESRRHVFGHFPAMSVALARKEFARLRLIIDQGGDPAGAKVKARKDAEEARERDEREITVRQLCEKYIAEHAVHKRSGAEDERRINRQVIPRWGDRKAKAVTRADVQDMLADLYEAGKNAEAQHCRALVSKIYNFARGHRKIDIDDNPCFGLPKVEKHQKVKARRRALTTQQEFRLFWHVTSGRPGWLQSMPQVEADCLRFMLLTGCRPSEAAELPWAEIDLDANEWVLHEDRSKNEMAHLVPLVPAAKAILLKYWDKDSRKRGAYVFPGPRGGSQSENRLANVMRRVCTRMERLAARYELPFEKVTPHDLRRTVETGMAAAKVPKEYRDRVLNHKDSSVGGTHYNVHDYADEKREALEKWARRLDTMVTGGSNVVPFRKVG